MTTFTTNKGADSQVLEITFGELKIAIAEELRRAAHIARATCKISDLDERDFFRVDLTPEEEKIADSYVNGVLTVADQLEATADFLTGAV